MPDLERYPGPADPDRIYQYQPKVTLNFTLFRRFQYTVQNNENYDQLRHSDDDEKDKTMLTGTVMNKSQHLFRVFQRE